MRFGFNMGLIEIMTSFHPLSFTEKCDMYMISDKLYILQSDYDV